MIEKKFKDLLDEAETLQQEYCFSESTSDLLYFADNAKDFIDEVVATIKAMIDNGRLN